MLVQMILRERDVLHGDKPLVRLEHDDLVDPHPAHGSGGQLPLDEIAQALDREESGKFDDLRVAREVAEGNVRDLLLKHREALGRDLAVLDERWVRHQVFRKQLALCNLERLLRGGELLLESEHNVEVVDALGSEVALEGCGRNNIILIDAKGIHENVTHVGFDIGSALHHHDLQRWSAGELARIGSVPKGAQYKATRDRCLSDGIASGTGATKHRPLRLEDHRSVVAHLVERDFDLETLAWADEAAVTERLHFAKHHPRHAPLLKDGASGLGQCLDHEHAGKHGETRKMVLEVFLGSGHVFNRDRRGVGEFEESIDEAEVHWRSVPSSPIAAGGVQWRFGAFCADIGTMAKTARNTSTRNSASEADTDVTTPADHSDLTSRRIVWVLLAALYVGLFFSLASFRSSDWPTHVVADPTDPPLNLCGRFGAATAYFLYSTFGFGIWIPTVYFGVLLVFAALGRSLAHPFVRFVGCLIAMCAFGALHAEWFPTVGPLTGVDAGLVPMFFADEMHVRFGPVGASIAFLAAFSLGAIVAADAIVAMLPGAVARSLSFLAPVWEADWKSHFATLRERASAMFPQPVAAGAGRGSRARRSTARPAIAVAKPNDALDEDADEDADETDDSAEDSSEMDESDDCADDSDAIAPVTATKKLTVVETKPLTEDMPERAPLSENELRAKIERLPIKMTAKAPTSSLRDEDIPRTENYEGYQFPTLDLLEEPEGNYSEKMEAYVREQAGLLTRTLATYGLEGEITHIESGPVVTLYSVELAAGTRVARLETVAKDIARALQAPNVRIIPNMVGRTSVGIEVPNKQKEKVRLKELMSSGHAANMMLPMFLGKDSAGEPLVLDLTKMPHMLIAGTTGSGKSVCMNTIIMSWLYTKRPDELKLVLVDPKMVEMAQFSEIPHLACPVITEMGKAAAILEWAVNKMEERYELFKEAGVRDIKSFNALTEAELRETISPADEVEWAKVPKKLPYMVFVIDELADLMMTNKEVEQSIVRIAQKARAVGIHLILATQRPQATVVTGLIKSNMPCRVGFKVASGTDSRIVLDQKGAELLLGQGDMLVVTPSQTDARRCQGTLVDDKEARAVTKFLKTVAAPSFERQLLTIRSGAVANTGNDGGSGGGEDAERDELFDKAVEIIIDSGRGSVSLLQRRLAIGYGRASRLVDQMGLAGILGEHKGSVAREVIVTMDDWRRMKVIRDEQERDGTVFQSHYDNSDANSEALKFSDEGDDD